MDVILLIILIMTLIIIVGLSGIFIYSLCKYLLNKEKYHPTIESIFGMDKIEAEKDVSSEELVDIESAEAQDEESTEAIDDTATEVVDEEALESTDAEETTEAEPTEEDNKESKAKGFTLSLSNKTKCILIYNNIGRPRITILEYKDKKLVFSKQIDLSEYELDNGLVANINGLAEVIKELVPNVGTIDVVLNLEDAIRDILSLPKLNTFKANSLYDKEMKNSFTETKDEYTPFKYSYTHTLGYVYNTYFIKNEVIDYFKKLAKLMKVRIGQFDLLGNYLYTNIKSGVKSDYVLIYVYDGLATFINTLDSRLVSFTSIPFKDTNDIISSFIKIMSKHEFEYSKSKLNSYILVSDDSIDLHSITDRLTKIDYRMSFDNYMINGKRL